MAIEIERKFLVHSGLWRNGPPGILFRQGYLSRDPERTVRVRRAGDTAFLTIKGIQRGLSRPEFEYPLPVSDADELLRLCFEPLIEKTRYERWHGGFLWEIDEFHGENAGLVVAEIELPSEAAQFPLPPWVGVEVSHDLRYSNSRLAQHPYGRWTE